jgi:hypothetical protein
MEFYARLYLSAFFIKREMFWTKIVEKIKRHTLRSIIFSPKSTPVFDIVWRTTGNIAVFHSNHGYVDAAHVMLYVLYIPYRVL